MFRTSTALLITWEENLGNKVLPLEGELVTSFWRSWQTAPSRRTITSSWTGPWLSRNPEAKAEGLEATSELI